MISENFIYLGIVFHIVAYYIYLKSMIFGQTRPNLVSWFIWMLAPFIGVFFQLQAGAGLSVIPIFMAGFGPLVVVMVSLLNKNGYWKINLFDIVCGIFALLSLIIYVITHNIGISIFFAILADALAFIPTFKKSWNFPETESAYAYACTIVSNTLGLLIIKEWSFTIYSFGIYLITFNIVMLFILNRKKFFSST